MRIALALVRLFKIPAYVITILMVGFEHIRLHYALVALALFLIGTAATKLHDVLEYIEIATTIWEHREDWKDSGTTPYLVGVAAFLAAALITVALVVIIAPDG